MSKFLRLTVILGASFIVTTPVAQAQSDRKSPPAKVEQTIGDLTVAINYSQPSVKEREIWGALVPYDKVWRTGANEATTISFSRAVSIDGNTVEAGTYSLFTIPGKGNWTFILNEDAKQWGAYKYNEDGDALRFSATPEKHEMTEMMTFSISEEGEVSLMWEELKVGFSIE